MPTADNNARGANDERHDDGGGAAAGGGEERRPRPTKIKPPTPKCGRGGLCNRCVTPEGWLLFHMLRRRRAADAPSLPDHVMNLKTVRRMMDWIVTESRV